MKSDFKIAIGSLLLAGVCSSQVAPAPVSLARTTNWTKRTIVNSTRSGLANSALTFTLNQPALVSGTANCYISGQLFASPERLAILGSRRSINLTAPLIHLSSAPDDNVYIGTSTDSETQQGSVAGWNRHQPSIPAITAASQPGINSSACNVYYSDDLIATDIHYPFDGINRSSSELAVYRHAWCVHGGAIYASQGARTGNCNTSGLFYAAPIFTNPQANNQKGINEPLGPGNYPITAGAVNGVLNAAAFPGVDIGAKVNAAFASAVLPAFAGVRIRIPAGSYTFTTPIVLHAAGNTGVILEGDASGTALHYAGPSNTTAITTDYAGGVGAGIRDITLDYTGRGSDVTGLALQTSSVWGVFQNLDIAKFANGVLLPIPLAYIDSWINCRIHNNTIGINDAAGVENQHWYGGSVDNNQTGVLVASSALGTDLYFSQVSFDDNTSVGISLMGGGSNVECDGCHFENAGGGTALYVTASQGIIKLIGGEILDDVATGTLAAFIHSSARAVYVSGTSMFTAGRRVAQAVLFSGGNGYLSFSKHSNIPFYNTAYSGFVSAVDFSTGRAGMTGNGTSGFYQSVKNTPGCTTPAIAGASCAAAVTVTWPVAFGDANYSVSCTGTGISNLPGPVYYLNKTAVSIRFNYQAGTSAAASYSSVDCIAVHD
jgi:hypothetical protein